MGSLSYLLLALGIVVGGIVVLFLRYVIFRASCALIDVEPPQVKSFVVVLFALAVALAIGVLTVLFGTQLFDVQQRMYLFILWCILGLGAIWLLLGLLYIPAVPVSLPKGFLLSAYEMVLGLLLGSLVTGLVLVIGAIYQIVINAGSAPRADFFLPPAPAITSSRLS